MEKILEFMTQTQKNRFVITDKAIFKRSLAESNCCKRFCRPVPNHSAKEPFVVLTSAKLLCFFGLCKTLL